MSVTFVTKNVISGEFGEMEGRFISYLRVSTDKQGKSGLGLEAQRQAVESYLNGGDWQLVSEYVETESGRKDDRPQLRAAMDHGRAAGATLVFAKVDRLARSVPFLRSVIDAGVDVVFCDLPNVPAGPTGRFILTQMAAVAELEAGLIGERTRAALAAAKARGVRLGCPNGAAALNRHVAEHGNGHAVAGARRAADDFAEGLRGVVAGMLAEGVTSNKALARELERRGFPTRQRQDGQGRASRWHPTMVARLRERLAI